jgi:hypothetical protein
MLGLVDLELDEVPIPIGIDFDVLVHVVPCMQDFLDASASIFVVATQRINLDHMPDILIAMIQIRKSTGGLILRSRTCNPLVPL